MGKGSEMALRLESGLRRVQHAPSGNVLRQASAREAPIYLLEVFPLRLGGAGDAIEQHTDGGAG